VAVAKLSNPGPDLPVLYELEGIYYIDRLTYDEPSQLLWIERSVGDFVFLTDVTVIGIPIGYCGPQRGIYDRLIFRKIPAVCER
jgi:hypothetical protein